MTEKLIIETKGGKIVRTSGTMNIDITIIDYETPSIETIGVDDILYQAPIKFRLERLTEYVKKLSKEQL